VDEVVFLGDIVGYGPHPSACIDRLRQLKAKAILGNHDAAALALGARAARDSHPVQWDEWTRDQLEESQLSYLQGLPTELTVDVGGVKVRAMHHPPGAPYLHPNMPDSLLASHLRAIPHPVVFCGHSHRHIDRTVNGRRYVCIPPVGQSRNGDSRAGYAVEVDGSLACRFVAYDVERVVADIESIGLAETFCRRWIRFLRTGFDVDWSREYRSEEAQNRISGG
jgi:diadenosine tetraphosphatase ApaH/serine/threonine PP2A family protein phosphatase